MMQRRTLLAVVLSAMVVAAVTHAEDQKQDGLAEYDAQIKPSHRKHWAFQPVHKPAVPDVRDGQWVRNPIDAFVLAKLEARGWEPSGPAEPGALLRRLYFDLTGLPPTIEEQDAFLLNNTRVKWERLVDDLLARPAHGERWGRHWLDLVRFAESNGYERDATKPFAWRFRDYVIDAVNADKPFDRFILEQLAGDELPDADASTQIAMGYFRLGPWDDEPADPAEDQFDQLDDLVSTTSQVFLGLTLGCARCHNHKFEPLTMHDYYRMVAVFHPLQRPQRGRDDVDLPAGSPQQLRTVIARLVGPVAGAAGPGLVLATVGSVHQGRRELESLPRGYFLYEAGGRTPETNLLLRGKAARPGPKVEPGMPAVLVAVQPPFPVPTKQTTQRRLTLGRWIASEHNPLTARVIVNRVWQYHMGEGLVRTPSDFGVMGETPTHPELLDWLADWFVREGWSLKKLHRLIVTSNTYSMSKRWRADYGAEDPQQRLLWRLPYRRLEVEAIRDAMLSASGQLQRQMHGPSMYPEVPRDALLGHSDPDKIWKQFDERGSSRRTVYAFLKRSLVVPMLEVLDLCDTARTSPRRLTTTVAPQALTLFNGDFVNRQARHLAERLVDDVGDDAERQIEHVFRLAVCRSPTRSELQALLLYMKTETAKLLAELGETDQPDVRNRAARQAVEQMCRIVFNLNEFVYLD